MLIISDVAQKKIVELIGKSSEPVHGLRISAQSVSPIKVDYRMAFISQAQADDSNDIIPFAGFNVFVDGDSTDFVDQATVDFVEGLMGSGFKIERPRTMPAGTDGTLVEKVQRVLDERVNPSVASHGGRVSLIDLKDKTVYLQLEGGCQGCGMADVTLKQGIEVMLKEEVPEIDEVLDTTDHANGKNPYYQSQV
ncbi:MAG: NifU family protein [Candidatus Latescibacterota bacterium]|nr:NifU family protein [Candidatus Latescibacterota bacterium]